MAEGKVANPGPLGLAGFALTTFVLSCQNAGLIPNEGGLWAMVPLALFYGGLAQMIAGVLEFRTGNTFGVAAFTSYGAFWMALAFLVIFMRIGIVPAKGFGDALGIFLLAWTIFTTYMTILTFSSKHGTLIAIFVALEITFILLVIGHYSGSGGITKIGGWTGIVTAFLAWYGSWEGIKPQFSATE